MQLTSTVETRTYPVLSGTFLVVLALGLVLVTWAVGTAYHSFSPRAGRRSERQCVPDIARLRRSFPRPACGERATRHRGKPDLGLVRGRFRRLRLAGAPPHPTFSPHAGRRSEKSCVPDWSRGLTG